MSKRASQDTDYTTVSASSKDKALPALLFGAGCKRSQASD